MRHLDLLKLTSLSFCIAFAPVQPVEAASSSPLAVTSASRLAGNGQSLNGRKANGRRMNGVALGGHTIRADGGMTVVSIRLPGAERRGR